MAQVLGMTIVTSAYGSGQRITSVAIEYSEPLIRSSLSADQFAVEGYAIANLCLSDTARGEMMWTGRFIQLLLEGGEDSLRLCEQTGRGMAARLSVRKPVLLVTQKQDLPTVAGNTAPAFESRPTTGVDLGIADRFIQGVFTTAQGKRLDYNLYIPEHLLPGQKYPLVAFLHDLGSCSPDIKAPLVQGTGATVWAIESYYNRRPCFVLAPHYADQCADDDYTVTWEADATWELIEHLRQLYDIDEKRIYGTGQSMGTMMLCELMLRHPKYFAGFLLVAGQWDPERLTAAWQENIWIIVSSGDAKAFPTMQQAVGNMEAAGARICYNHINARADAAWLDAAIRSQKQKGATVNLTWFEGRSVVPDGQEPHPGAHHVNTWVKAYDIKALREWLFEQRLP
ncbi:MAG: hypothetical protein ACI4O7_05100 [Aristaeellaceae bacterium]